MGTPAQVDVGTIYFDTHEQAKNALDVLRKWIDNVNAGNCDESLKGDLQDSKKLCRLRSSNHGRV